MVNLMEHRAKVQQVVAELSDGAQTLRISDDPHSCSTGPASVREDSSDKFSEINRLLEKEELGGQISKSLDVPVASKLELTGKLEVMEMERAELRRNLREMAFENDRLSVDLAQTHAKAVTLTENKFKKALDRNLEIIDKLLAEKQAAAARIGELEACQKACESKLKQKEAKNEDLFRKELAREKETLALREKQVRSKWEVKRLAEIKEQTVKGLEPEIERIIAQHRNEKRLMERRYEESIENLRNELLIKSSEQVSAALDRERELCVERERRNFERFAAQLEQERRRFANELAQARSVNDRSKADEVARARSELEAEMQERKRQLTQELETEFQRRISQMQGELELAKQGELETLINKLARENYNIVQSSKSEDFRKHEAEKAKWIEENEALRSELGKAETALNNEQARCNKMFADLEELQKRVTLEETLVSQKEQQLKSRFEEAQNARAENEKIRASINEMCTQHSASLSALKGQHDDDKANIELRIKRVMDIKNESITQLNDRITYLESKNREYVDLITNKKERLGI